MKNSTKQIVKLHGLRIDRAIHYYIYFTAYRTYVQAARLLTWIVVKTLSWFKPASIIPRFIFARYHAKIVSTQDVKKILNLNQDVILGSDHTHQIIPFKYANKIVLRQPEHIAVMDCPCKLARKDPCQPVSCCIAIGKPIVDFWLEHCEKYHVRKITQEEALKIIQEQRKTGHITQAFFKVATGGVTGVFCNCCPKCCVSLEASRLSRKIKGAEKVSMTAPSGYNTTYDPHLCKLCGECAKICPYQAIKIENGKRIYQPNFCMGCELCVEKCPQGAIRLVLGDTGILPLDIDLAREKLKTT